MNSAPKNFRTKASTFLTTKPFVIILIITTSAAMAIVGGTAYLAGLLVTFVVLWAIRWDWSYFGLRKPQWGKALVGALGYTVVAVVLIDIVLTPLVEYLTGIPHDHSAFTFLEDNLAKLLVFMVIMWIIAGFGEEFYYRGYIMKRLATLMGDSDKAWLWAMVLSAIPFGIVHFYQGLSGMITTGLAGLLFGFIFYRNRKDLVVCMLTHGIYNMVGLTVIYLGKADLFPGFGEKLWGF